MRIDKEKWHIAQGEEMGFWNSNLSEMDEGLANSERQLATEVSALIWGRFGYFPTSFDGKGIIDIGCGPTARCSCFSGARLSAIEPLSKSYFDMPGARMRDYEYAFDDPAEKQITFLMDSAELVVCMNCLDHCYDAEAVIRNMLRYLTSGGVCFLSVDVMPREFDDPLHPLRMQVAEIESLILQVGGETIWRDHGKAYPYNEDGELKWQDGWAGGETVAHHWKFKKVA